MDVGREKGREAEGERKRGVDGRARERERQRERERRSREGGGSGTGGNKALTGRVIPRYVTDGTTGCLMGSLRSSLVYPELRGRNREERRYPDGGIPGSAGGGGQGYPAAVRREDDIYKTQGHEYGYRYLSVNTAGDVASTCYDDVTMAGAI